MNQTGTAAEQAVAKAATQPVTAMNAAMGRLICRLAFLPLYYGCVGAMLFYGRYRISQLGEVRRRFQEIAAEPGPLAICANHLTFIDSALILWAFGSGRWYWQNFDKFSWNLPAGDFFRKKLFHRFMGTISKCLFIHRNGSKEHKESVLKVCAHLLKSGEVITLFPEGKRSRTGRFDPNNLTFGIGKIVSELGSCRVLCVYLRGDRQDTYSNYPARGSKFHLDMELIYARTAKAGREGYQEVVSQVGQSIKAMEDRYFACGGEKRQAT